MHNIHRIRRVARRMLPKGVILLYHRIAEVASDPQLLSVTPQHFAEHLEILQQGYNPLSLRTLHRRMKFNLWRYRTVAITFDDGYADNLHQAKPLLEAVDVPATVFVTTGKVDSSREFWWDELERILLSTPILPNQLAITIKGEFYHWELGRNDEENRIDDRWHVLMESGPSPRQVAYLKLARLLQGMENRTRVSVLEQLVAWAGLEAYGRPGYRALTSEEAQTFAQNGLVEIGAHTMTHPALSGLPVEVQRVEITASKRRLEELLEQPVTSFSYPFGGRDSYNADTVRLVKEAGFECACSNFPGHVQWRVDPYQLPRFIVRDWDGDEFARRLRGMFDL